MNRPVRILVITLGLVVAGAAFGGLSGVVAFAISMVVSGESSRINEAWVWLVPGSLGALFGGVAAPSSGWLFLRRVPLGRAFLGSVLGAVIGGVAGWTLAFGHEEIVRAIIGAVIGYFLAVVALRWRGQSAGLTKIDS